MSFCLVRDCSAKIHVPAWYDTDSHLGWCQGRAGYRTLYNTAGHVTYVATHPTQHSIVGMDVFQFQRHLSPPNRIYIYSREYNLRATLHRMLNIDYHAHIHTHFHIAHYFLFLTLLLRPLPRFLYITHANLIGPSFRDVARNRFVS